MLFIFMQMYFKELEKSFKDIAKSTEAAITGETDYREQNKEREMAMAEADGIEMSDEDIEKNVAILSESSPHKMRVEKDFQRMLKVMQDG
tara:strand:- start:1782 stop:2051 length:270 start_codon:yes stop_codon:yes gene_type:complete